MKHYTIYYADGSLCHAGEGINPEHALIRAVRKHRIEEKAACPCCGLKPEAQFTGTIPSPLIVDCPDCGKRLVGYTIKDINGDKVLWYQDTIDKLYWIDDQGTKGKF